ncbi:MAG: alpha/beta hydrolase [Polaromonas sp.]
MTTLPLFLVPGLMCDHAVWEPLLPRLGYRRACTVVNHGSADSLEQMARQMLDAAPAQILLAGHSMGARVVLEALRQAPDRVRGVALLDTGYLPKFPGATGEDESRKRFALLKVAREQGVGVMAREWVTGMVHRARLDDDELIERIISMFERKNPDIFACQIKSLLDRPDGSDVLRAITVPTLVMCGRQDAWSPVTQHKAMQALAPCSELEVIEDAGHMAPMERPNEVAQAIERWLARCDSFSA